MRLLSFFFLKAEDGIRDVAVTGVQTCALPISGSWHPCDWSKRLRRDRADLVSRVCLGARPSHSNFSELTGWKSAAPLCRSLWLRPQVRNLGAHRLNGCAEHHWKTHQRAMDVEA